MDMHPIYPYGMQGGSFNITYRLFMSTIVSYISSHLFRWCFAAGWHASQVPFCLLFEIFQFDIFHHHQFIPEKYNCCHWCVSANVARSTVECWRWWVLWKFKFRISLNALSIEEGLWIVIFLSHTLILVSEYPVFAVRLIEYLLSG